MIKKIKEFKIIDFDVVFIVSIVIISLIMFIAIKISEIDFSTTDIYAETIPEATISSSNSLGEIQGTIDSRVIFSSGGLIDTRYGIGVKPIYTADQMTDYIMRKGNELISIMQTIAQPFCLIFFILGCGATLLGALSGSVGKGLITMGCSAIIYVCILYAPTLINSLPSFLAN